MVYPVLLLQLSQASSWLNAGIDYVLDHCLFAHRERQWRHHHYMSQIQSAQYRIPGYTPMHRVVQRWCKHLHGNVGGDTSRQHVTACSTPSADRANRHNDLEAYNTQYLAESTENVLHRQNTAWQCADLEPSWTGARSAIHMPGALR